MCQELSLRPALGAHITVNRRVIVVSGRKNCLVPEGTLSKQRTTLRKLRMPPGSQWRQCQRCSTTAPTSPPETRRRVLKYLRDSEYRPAGSGLVRTRELSRSIEVVVPELEESVHHHRLGRHHLISTS